MLCCAVEVLSTLLFCAWTALIAAAEGEGVTRKERRNRCAAATGLALTDAGTGADVLDITCYEVHTYVPTHTHTHTPLTHIYTHTGIHTSYSARISCLHSG